MLFVTWKLRWGFSFVTAMFLRRSWGRLAYCNLSIRGWLLRHRIAYERHEPCIKSGRATMSIEIERRFLVKNENWRPRVDRKLQIKQGYLTNEGSATVRIRILDNRHATLTVKSHAASTCREEFEYPIPLSDALSLIDLRAGGLVSKVRHIVVDHDLTWEIDVFEGTNAGLIIAEVELKKINQNIRLPDWIGHEISGDARFSNSHLAKRPYWAFEPSLDDIEASLIGE